LTAPHAPAADPHAPDVHGHGDSHGHGTRRGYLTGFLLAVLLTAVPFWLVMGGVLPNPQWTALLIFAFALVQIIVHVRYFLHLDTRSEGGWTLISFVFTVVIVGIVIGGSIWIMFHLNNNMMPAMPMMPDAR
jgi:cytochrome o ubiquinol oxidase operon protein cyoD